MENKTDENNEEKLRGYLLRCSSIPTGSEALKIALTALDEFHEGNTEVPDRMYSPIKSTSDGNNITTHQFVQSRSFIDVKPRQGQSMTPATSKIYIKERGEAVAFTFIRCLSVDIPLVMLFAVTCFIFSVHHVQQEYLSPQLKLLEFNGERRAKEMTFYNRHCTAEDLTASNVEDLLIPHNFTADQSLDHMMTHGMSVYQDILSPETSSELRDYILKRNAGLTKEEAIGVIENENRWSFGFGANEDPIVSKALNEVATHPVFRPAIEKISGKNPAVIEFTTISTAYGAVDQFWHPDVMPESGALQYSKSFIPSFALFTTLQDTTAEMGATGICPGTYRCSEIDREICDEFGFQVSGNGVWKAGNSILMNQQSIHRGTAHIDPNAPTRVLFIVTFTPRPEPKAETRQFSQGGSYSTRWDMWGHTLYDLEKAPTAMKQPWATLRSIGLYKSKDADWGWDFTSLTLMRIANHDTGYNPSDLQSYLEGLRLPSILTPDLDVSTWENLFVNYLLLWKRIAINANIIAIAFYALITVCICSVIILIRILRSKTSKSPGKDLFQSIIKTILRIGFIDGMVLFITIRALTLMAETDWARDIKAGRLWRPSFGISKVDEKHVFEARPTELIMTNDILINSHYDSKALGGYTEFLNYHPGNTIFNSEIRGASPLFQVVSQGDKDKMIDIIQNGLTFHHRFLLQNHWGDWNVLTEEEIKNYIGRSLCLKQSALVMSLEEEKLSLLAFHDGQLSTTVMGTKFGPLLVNDLMDKIYEHEVPFIFKFHSSDPTNNLSKEDISIRDKKTNAQKMSKGKSIFLPNSKGKEVVLLSHHSSKRSLMHLHDASPIQKTHALEMKDTDHILKSGSKVEAKFAGQQNVWYKGTIRRIRQGSLFDIEYADGGNDFGLSILDVVHFRPYQVGEVVEARKRGQKAHWQKALIKKVPSAKSVEVFYSDGDSAKVNHIFVRRFNHDFKVGDLVSVREGKRSRKARIVWVNNESHVEVAYENGTYETIADSRRILDWYWFEGRI